jgi:hypothetical protein
LRRYAGALLPGFVGKELTRIEHTSWRPERTLGGYNFHALLDLFSLIMKPPAQVEVENVIAYRVGKPGP